MRMAALRSVSSLPALQGSARYYRLGRTGWRTGRRGPVKGYSWDRLGEEVMGLPLGKEEERTGPA